MESLKFAFSSFLLVFFILFPGIVLKRSYFRGEFSKQFSQGEFSDRIITTFFWGCFAQVIILILFSNTVDENIDINFLLKLVGGLNIDGINVAERLDNKILVGNYVTLIKEDYYHILIYFIFLFFIPFILGYLGHLIIRTFHLDRYTSAFRFANYWYYYYSGEIITRKEFEKAANSNVLGKNGVEEVLVDVVVDNGERTALYQGFFSQYTICKTTNKLESIFLTSVKRYSYTDKIFKPINSSIFHIPAEKIYNLNIRYIEKSTSKNHRNKEKIINIFFVTILLVNLVFPWVYMENAAIINLIGMIFGFITVTLITTLVHYILFVKNKDKNEILRTIFVFLVLILILLFIQLKILNIF